MKFGELMPGVVSMQPLALRPDQVAEAVGGEGVVRLGRDSGWLVPEVESTKITLYDREVVEAFWKRLKTEGYEALRAAAGLKRASRKNRRRVGD